jgi:ATP-dependent Lhr-like helicase
MPSESADSEADVQLDYVGSLANAATVIARLHRGEKRLVFLDSRARAEHLASDLRRLGVTTFVTHSSLSQDQRRQAEDAFANRDDCVIVATSFLELGIDVGNLDRVIQIDCPSTVSGFLQRMGRTGRRPGIRKNCLFLATRDEALLQAAALIDLCSAGYVEPIEPPAEPYHILAQQFMALALQEHGIGLQTWFNWLERVPAFQRMPVHTVQRVVDWMMQKGIIWQDEGIVGIGKAGEEVYGRRHFMELLSVFISAPLFRVLHGRDEVGSVDELTFHLKRDPQHVLLLGGRSWQVTHLDWRARVAYVTPSDDNGVSRWRGGGQNLSYRLCQAIKSVLLAQHENERSWSRRATDKIIELRREFWRLGPDCSTFLYDSRGKCTWWTFAGTRANAALASGISQVNFRCVSDNLALRFNDEISVKEIEGILEQLRARDRETLVAAVDQDAIDGLKFSECLPPDLAKHVVMVRNHDAAAIENTLAQSVRVVSE